MVACQMANGVGVAGTEGSLDLEATVRDRASFAHVPDQRHPRRHLPEIRPDLANARSMVVTPSAPTRLAERERCHPPKSARALVCRVSMA